MRSTEGKINNETRTTIKRWAMKNDFMFRDRKQMPTSSYLVRIKNVEYIVSKPG